MHWSTKNARIHMYVYEVTQTIISDNHNTTTHGQKVCARLNY